MTPTDKPTKQLRAVLEKAHRSPFRTKSNFAREQTDTLAAAASCGLITTQTGPRTFGTTWLITRKGLDLLNEFYR